MNLVIAIGLLAEDKRLGFVTYRYLKKPFLLFRIETIAELPSDWGLNTRGVFSFGAELGKFWPKDVMNQKSDSSEHQIQAFNYFNENRMFIMSNNSDIDGFHPYSVRYIERDGHLSNWQTIDLQLNSNSLDKSCLNLFEMNGNLFSFCRKLNNSLISYEMSVHQIDGKPSISAKRVVNVLQFLNQLEINFEFS